MANQSVEAWQGQWIENDVVEQEVTADMAVQALIPYASGSDKDYPQTVVVPTHQRANLPA